jgi:hypothetical protein
MSEVILSLFRGYERVCGGAMSAPLTILCICLLGSFAAAQTNGNWSDLYTICLDNVTNFIIH